ncbi:MAG: stage II sporulation protein M [Oscillospiraceae bacterium]|nr:stage II sporulation protein M [Oscillospiraceae bacterium]
MVKRAGRGQQIQRGIRKLFYRNEIFVLLSVLFLAGILLGACFIRVNGENWGTFIGQMVEGFSNGRESQTLPATFLQSATGAFFFLLALFLCGFCAVGQPLVCLILLFRGLGYGLTAGGVYSVYGPSGMGYVALFLMPNCVLTALILLRAGQSAFRFSTGLYGAMKGAGKMNARPYCLEFAILGACLLGAALVDSVFSYLFGGSFPLVG